MSDELLSEIDEAREHLSRVRDRVLFGHLAAGSERNAFWALVTDVQVALLQAAIDDIDANRAGTPMPTNVTGLFTKQAKSGYQNLNVTLCAA